MTAEDLLKRIEVLEAEIKVLGARVYHQQYLSPLPPFPSSPYTYPNTAGSQNA